MGILKGGGRLKYGTVGLRKEEGPRQTWEQTMAVARWADNYYHPLLPEDDTD